MNGLGKAAVAFIAFLVVLYLSLWLLPLLDSKTYEFCSSCAVDPELVQEWEEPTIITPEEYTSKDPVSYLEYAGKQRGLTDEEITTLKAIMWCESRFDPNAQNPNSTASGAFQIVRSTFIANSDYPWEQRYGIMENIETALNLYERRGTQPWVCKKMI